MNAICRSLGLSAMVFAVSLECMAAEPPSVWKALEYGLIGSSHDIEVDDDLLEFAEWAYPQPFSSDALAFPFYQCFDVEKVAFRCRSFGFDPFEGDEFGDIVLIAINEIRNKYVFRRGVPISECQQRVDRWLALMWKQKYVCISGSIVRESTNERSWIWQRLRTKRGMDDWFDRP